MSATTPPASRPASAPASLPPYERSHEYAAHCDTLDPLAAFRDQFALPRAASGDPLVYLCGHSLGLQPLAARARVLEDLDAWARLGVSGHEHGLRPWIDYQEHLAPGLAALIGARAGEVIAMNSLTINLHLMLVSFYRPTKRRTKILMESGCFPSDRHAVVSQILWHGLDPRAELIELDARDPARGIGAGEIEEVLRARGEEIALVLWPGVQYLTGQAFDVAAVTRAACAVGASVGFDLAHAIGNLPLALHDSGADFAVWCSYKYLNAGPGAVAGCFVHERHGAAFDLPRLCGWWGHERASRFAMAAEFRGASGAAGWAVSNPPILSSAPLLASLELFRRADIARLRTKSIALTGYLEYLLDRLGIELATPRAVEARGCQLSLRLPPGAAARPGAGERILRELDTRGVVCDWREPDILRVAPAPLYNGFVDVLRFCEHLERACASAR